MPAESDTWLIAIASVLGAYLCGAIPFGLLVGWARGIDIRTRGSGNIGATNAGRVLGTGFGILVFALDLLKGLLPVAAWGFHLARTGGLPSSADGGFAPGLAWVAVAAACVLGHMFPIYLRFKGGKGVATSLGVVLGIYPYFTGAGLAALGLWVVVTLATRYVSVGSITAALAFPVAFAAVAQFQPHWGGIRQLWPLHLMSVVVALLVVYRHRGNLRRLAVGTEPRILRSRDGQN